MDAADAVTVTFGYDANGSLTSEHEGTTLKKAQAYDLANRLVEADTNGDSVADLRLQYDHQEGRVARHELDAQRMGIRCSCRVCDGGVLRPKYCQLADKKGQMDAEYHNVGSTSGTIAYLGLGLVLTGMIIAAALSVWYFLKLVQRQQDTGVEHNLMRKALVTSLVLALLLTFF